MASAEAPLQPFCQNWQLCLDCLGAAFASADADAVVEREDEDFAVADFAGVASAAATDDGVDRGLDEVFVHRNLKLDFAEQIDGDFMPAINLGLPLLPTKALYIHDRQTNHFDVLQGSFYVFELTGLNNREDEFHAEGSGVMSQDSGEFQFTLSQPSLTFGALSCQRRMQAKLPGPGPLIPAHVGHRYPGLGGSGGETTQTMWGILLGGAGGRPAARRTANASSASES